MRTLVICATFLIATTGCEWRSSRTSEWTKEKPQAEAEHGHDHEHGHGPGQHTHDADDVAITEADVEMPADYAAVVKRLRFYSDRIKVAIEAKTPGKAHRPLDEAEIVISHVMEITKSSDVPRQDWEEINLARRSLREGFDKIHAAIDKGEDPGLPAVEPEIEAALKKLEAVAAKEK